MHIFLQGEAASTIVRCSSFEHRHVLGQWDFGKGCITQHWHQMHLGTNERPS